MTTYKIEKKYSRKALIAFFAKLSPRSKPLKNGLCPIATFLKRKPKDGHAALLCNLAAARLDRQLAEAIDDQVSDWDANYYNITAGRIVKIAKELPRGTR